MRVKPHPLACTRASALGVLKTGFFIGAKMSRPKRNFAPMPLAVLASDCSPQEKLFVLAIMHHDWDGEKAWPSMDRIASLTGFKERTLREARQRLEAKGWIKSEPRKGRSNIYSLDIPDMTLDQFNQQMNPGTRRRGKESESGTERHPSPALDATLPGMERHTLNNRAIEAEPIETKPLPATAGKGGKHPDEKAFWDFAKLTFEASTKQKLIWPAMGWFQKSLTSALLELGVEELTRRWDNYLVYPYGVKSPQKFLSDLNAWAKRQDTPTGGANARAFVQPKTDWKSSGLKAPDAPH